MSSPEQFSLTNTLLNTPPPPLDYFNSFPPGYRFKPSDEELILCYLNPKVNNQTLPKHRIVDVNLYQHNPQDLADKYKDWGEGGWYFFTSRDRKYKNGFRPKRAAGNGYWKATGADKELKSRDEIIGYKRSLVFYVGKAPKGDKTNWIMHEYRVNTLPIPANKRGQNDMRLDDWVLCRIYKKTDKKCNTRTYRKKDAEVCLISNTVDDAEVSENEVDGPTADFEGKTTLTEPFLSFATDADVAGYSSSFYGLATGMPLQGLLEIDQKPLLNDEYYPSLPTFQQGNMPLLPNSASYGKLRNPPPSDHCVASQLFVGEFPAAHSLNTSSSCLLPMQGIHRND